jgi:hypothetical protein
VLILPYYKDNTRYIFIHLGVQHTNNQLKGAAEEMAVAATLTGSSNKCNTATTVVMVRMMATLTTAVAAMVKAWQWWGGLMVVLSFDKFL